MELRGAMVRLRALRAEDYPALLAIRATPQVHYWWGPPEHERDVADLDDAEVLVIELAERPVGVIQWLAEDSPDFRHAGIDIYLDPAVHGNGVGPDAIRTLAAWLIDTHGHHRLTIDPAKHNTAAVRAYQKVGFRPVGVLRRYWRDPDGAWRDGLLMDLLAEELVR